MNKKVLTFITAAALPAMVFAKSGNHPMSGCGLGYVLFGNTDNSKLMQIFAATTNGTSGNQTFGITSGTSGCTEDGAVKFVKEAELYAEVNLDTLRREMAAGAGESVQTFASLLGASEATRPAVVSLMKQNYAQLFPSSNTSSTELLSSLHGLLSQHADLLS
jgi:hypothetical protein